MLVRGGDGVIRGVAAVPMWLVQMLSRQRLGAMKIGPEDQISIEFGDRCRAWAIEGRLKGTFTKIPHEVGAVPRKSVGFRTAQARYAKQEAMGMVAGSGDFVFVWADGGGWIEFKSDSGSLSPKQRRFRDWCEREGVRWAVCRSADDGETILKAWGVLV